MTDTWHSAPTKSDNGPKGDDDGAIRDAVRQAIYHGDDFTKADEVQEVLDIIEESQSR